MFPSFTMSDLCLKKFQATVYLKAQFKFISFPKLKCEIFSFIKTASLELFQAALLALTKLLGSFVGQNVTEALIFQDLNLSKSDTVF